jgi:hypothetical protein
MWFVQDGKIYPTPTLYGVVAARLVRAHFAACICEQLGSSD